MVQADLAHLSSKVDTLNRRITHLEKSITKAVQSNQELEKMIRQSRADQSVALEDLRTELKTLNGSLDVLRHDLDQAGKLHQKVQEDFDTRLTEMEHKLSATIPPSKKSKVSDIARYNKILRMLRGEKKYDTAISKFRTFIREYPESSLTASAQYWIGEGYFAKGEYGRAISEFQNVIDKYPQSSKKCDALLKQGVSFMKMKESQKARLFFTETQRQCPNTSIATKAKKFVAKLAQPTTKK